MRTCINGHENTVTAYCATIGDTCHRFGSWGVHPETGELFPIHGEG